MLAIRSTLYSQRFSNLTGRRQIPVHTDMRLKTARVFSGPFYINVGVCFPFESIDFWERWLRFVVKCLLIFISTLCLYLLVFLSRGLCLTVVVDHRCPAVMPDHSSSFPVNSLSITGPGGDSICRPSECKASALPLYFFFKGCHPRSGWRGPYALMGRPTGFHFTSQEAIYVCCQIKPVIYWSGST